MRITRRLILTSFALLPALFLTAASAWAGAPAIGSWVEYALVTKGQPKEGDTVNSTVKVAVVGQEEGNFWFEFAITENGETTLRKLLAPYKAPAPTAAGYKFWGEIKRLIVQTPGKAPEEVPAQFFARHEPELLPALAGINRRASETLEGPKLESQGSKSFKVGAKAITAEVKVETKTERSKVNLGFIAIEDQSTVKAEFAVSDQVPVTTFAAASAEVETASTTARQGHEPTKKGPRKSSSALTLAGFGAGAKSAVKGEPVPMKQNPFPFLQPAKK